MVIVRLAGGLGNQMFKYAAGKRLALVRGVELKLDINRLEGDSYRKYQLGAFDIPEAFASEKEIRQLKLGSLSTWLLLHIRPWIGVKVLPPTFYRERPGRFDPTVLQLGGNVYLKGRLHSWKYFQDVTDEISERFRIKDPSLKARDLMGEISGCESVSVHVRRGDYVSDPSNYSRYGVCDRKYYEECIRRVLALGGSPRFFVFSDEPAWVRENMVFPEGSYFVTRDGLNSDAEELYLMSLCQKHVTANSTFSWWGAWLGRHSDKVVFTPDKWFKSDDLDSDGLIPDDWVRV